MFVRRGTCIALIFVLASCTAAPRVVERPANESLQLLYQEDFEAVTNSDLKWVASSDGVLPKLNFYAEQLLSKLEDESRAGRRASVIRTARNYLTDPKRFVMAHVVLTLFVGRPYTNTAHSWNRLEFTDNGTSEMRPIDGAIKVVQLTWSDPS